MNIIYTVTWPEAATATFAKAFYQQLRAGVARGTSFAFNSPYEVALVCNRDHAGAQPFVVILGMSVATQEILNPTGTIPVLQDWFTRCGAELRDGWVVASQATHLKVSSELGISVNVQENFGTFVGEPEPETAADAKKPEVKKPPVLLETAGLKAVLGEPLTAAEKAKLAPPPPDYAPTFTSESQPITAPPPLIFPNRTGDIQKIEALTAAAAGPAPTRSIWLTVGLLAFGSLVVSAGLIVAGMLLLGNYTENGETVTTAPAAGDIIAQLLLCSGPFLIFGGAIVIAGFFALRLFRASQRIDRQLSGKS